ncbi:lipopolysaccharide assembly LapA domain-containing protein [Alicyclobacillus sp. SP_1]|uniref:LapA family protein n=1 Tax=Alicyclobacillus sp. SP_1 TaxID=2942475 RepID=UPI00215868AE|nr:LapA family protein [Alicyclobacillus sp. SP_1]
MRLLWRLIVGLFLAVVVAVFAVINVQVEAIHFLFGTAHVPLVLIILGSAFVGGLVVGFIGIVLQFRLRRRNSQLRREVEKHKAQLDKLQENQTEVLDGKPEVPQEEASAPASEEPSADAESS